MRYQAMQTVLETPDAPTPLEKVALETYVPPAKPSLIGLSRAEIAERLAAIGRSEEHTSELQSHSDLVCRLLLEKKKVENNAAAVQVAAHAALVDPGAHRDPV